MRLDVHPVSGDIVFDILGDLYCLPGSEALAFHSERVHSPPIRARPVLLGVPHDSDPHFSPNGDRLVFRSDAELGVENIWVIAWRGCEAMDVRSIDREDIVEAMKRKDEEEQMLVAGIRESQDRKLRRLIREGRERAQRVTNETYRWVSDARFHPLGDKIIATKWYTSERSLGAGEGWEYDVPSVGVLGNKNHRTVVSGSGTRVVSRTLPLGWGPQEYGDQQIGPEQLIWSGIDSLIYSKNVRDASAFTYSKDVHSGIYAIYSRNLTSGHTELLVDAFPGGASRPELSHDGRTLAFVRRERDKEILVLKDLVSGTIHYAWDGLTYDLTAISAPMGTYPSFSFIPDDSAIVIWAAGRIYKVPLVVNSMGERRASNESPVVIEFNVHIEKRLAETVRGGVDLVYHETQSLMQVRALTELNANDDGKRVVFQAAGRTYLHSIETGNTLKVPTLHEKSPYYSPSFVPRANNFIIHARWSDVHFTSLEIANIETQSIHEIEGLPLGRYIAPTLCECAGGKRQIAIVKTGGDVLTGDVVATAHTGLYIGDIKLPSHEQDSSRLSIENLRLISVEIDTTDRISLRFLNGNKHLLVQQSTRAFVIDLATKHKKQEQTVSNTVASGKMTMQVAVSPKLSKKGHKHRPANVAFVDVFNVYLVPATRHSNFDDLWSKPGNATTGLARLSLDGGHDITWSGDGKHLFWLLGPHLHSLEVSKLDKCASAIRHDGSTFGLSCIKDLLWHREIIVQQSTDIARLKEDATLAAHVHKEWLHIENNADVVVINNATILTMETGEVDEDLIQGGRLVVQGGVIQSIETSEESKIPEGATVIDAQGGFIVPGFVDVHAHWNGFETKYPAASWEMAAYLSHGVTTVHNPSASIVGGVNERNRIEGGQIIGPRIFTVGEIIYGAGISLHQDIVDQAEAQSALVRLKVEGGPMTISYKNYNLPSRASRQRLLLSARNLSMSCVPEGGMNFDWDLTYIVDGMTTVEHALPIPTLFEDVRILFVASGTGSTPTHIVNYGGVFGEQYLWATEDIPNNPKLRRFTRHDILEGVSESTARPRNSYALFNTSASVAMMVKNGLLANIGAHGEPPLGVMYHAEMFFTQQGGLTNYEVLRAATVHGATTLGLNGSLGTLTAGKLADFLVYPPGVDLLHGDISETRKLALVARGGRIWDASTLEEMWPVKGRQLVLPPINP
ncbi:hypothetical protein AMATHDRAFT_173604 [Amanita thiersii Skay4041]|uniref:Amidohydrolase-related domain-containing protein n=1 Tax=Amanita thiersii Skay4041 TaxID=703135 RepID=A0A2A9NX91_9AGAR|nr:hypothetical protein AMATHDRAFT_173604 [Amanita thiersii Skay4041]